MRDIRGKWVKTPVAVKILSSDLRSQTGGKAAATMLEHFSYLMEALQVNQIDVTVQQLEHGLDRRWDYMKHVSCGLGESAIKDGISRLVKLGYLKKGKAKRSSSGRYEIGVYSLDNDTIQEAAEKICGRKSTELHPPNTVGNRLKDQSEIDGSYGRKTPTSLRTENRRTSSERIARTSEQSGGSFELLISIGISKSDASQFQSVAKALIEHLIAQASLKGVLRLGPYVLQALRKGAQLPVSPAQFLATELEAKETASAARREAAVLKCLEILSKWYAEQVEKGGFTERVERLIQAKRASRKKMSSDRALELFEAEVGSESFQAGLLLDEDASFQDRMRRQFGDNVLDEARLRWKIELASQLPAGRKGFQDGSLST